MARCKTLTKLISRGTIIGAFGAGTTAPWVAGTRAGRDVLAGVCVRGLQWKFKISCVGTLVTELNNPAGPHYDKSTFTIAMDETEFLSSNEHNQLRNVVDGTFVTFNSERDFATAPVIIHPAPEVTGDGVGTYRNQTATGDTTVPYAPGVAAFLAPIIGDPALFLQRNGDQMVMRAPAFVGVDFAQAYTTQAAAAVIPGNSDPQQVGTWTIRVPGWPTFGWHTLEAPLYGRFGHYTNLHDIDAGDTGKQDWSYTMDVEMTLVESLPYGHDPANPGALTSLNRVWNEDGTMAILPRSA